MLFDKSESRGSFVPWVLALVVAAGIGAALVPHGRARFGVLLAGGDPRAEPRATLHADFAYPRDPLEWSLALDPTVSPEDRARVLAAADAVADDVGWWLLSDTGAPDVAEAERRLWARDHSPKALAEAWALRVQRDAIYARPAFGGRYLPDAKGDPAYVHPDELTLLFLHVAWALDLKAELVPSPVHRYVLLHEPGGERVRGVEPSCFRCVGEQTTTGEPAFGPWLEFPEDFYRSGVGGIRNPVPLPRGTYVPVPPDALEGVLLAGVQARGKPDLDRLFTHLAAHPDDAAVADVLWTSTLAEGVKAAEAPDWDTLRTDVAALQRLRKEHPALAPADRDDGVLVAALAWHDGKGAVAATALAEALQVRDAARGSVQTGDVVLPKSPAHALGFWLALEHGVAGPDDWNLRVVPLLAVSAGDPVKLDRLCRYGARLLANTTTPLEEAGAALPGPRPMSGRPGVVLSGGGARGAYEAGVLQWMLEDLAREGRRPHLHAVCGTSVGAIHAAFLASALHDPAAAAVRLGEVWSELSLDRVLRIGAHEAFGLWRVAMGGGAGAGLFDARPLTTLVGRAIAWDRMHENVRAGVVRDLTVTATHVPTGRPVVFLEAPDDEPLPFGSGRRVVVRRARIDLPRVLASASIPLVFPPVKVDGDLYCDGGLRLNTPMGPALRLGSDRLFVVALNTTREEPAPPELGEGRYPGAPFLLGKMLNAFLLDHVAQDLENLERVNRLLGDAQAAGADPAAMARAAVASGHPVHHRVEATAIRPSEDLGELAADHLRRLSWVGRAPAVHALLKLVDVGEGSGSDLASYLLFDRSYTRALLDLGRRDAERSADRLRGVLGGHRFGAHSPTGCLNRYTHRTTGGWTAAVPCASKSREGQCNSTWVPAIPFRNGTNSWVPSGTAGWGRWSCSGAAPTGPSWR